MVTTVTLSPSLDKTYIVAEMKDDILNYAKKTVLLPGSKGINVSRLLSRLEVPNTAIGLSGGAFGGLLESLMRQEKVEFDFTHSRSDIRFNVKIIDLANSAFTDVNERGEAVTEEEYQRFLENYKVYLRRSDYVVLAGSLRDGMPEETYVSLIQMAHQEKVPVFLDCCGGCLRRTLAAKPFLVAPNIHELSDCFGEEFGSLDKVVECAKQIHKNGIAYAIVTMGADGAVLACANGVYKMTPPPVHTKNTTGAGDSFLAGILYGMLRHASEEEMLRIAGSVSTAKVAREDTGMPDKNELFDYYSQTRAIKIED